MTISRFDSDMGEEIYRPMIEDMTWSYSRISAFIECPYKWFMKYICGETETPMFYSSYGKFMHELLADYYSGRLSRDGLKTRYLLDFSKRVQGERPSGSITESYVTAGSEYFDSFEMLPFKTIAVEDPVVFDVRSQSFIGFIDLVGCDDDGLVVVDHKSRKLSPRSNKNKPTAKDAELDEMLRQLYLYAEAVKQNYGEYPVKLCFNCFRTGKLIEEPFDDEKLDSALDWAAETIEEITNTEVFAPHPEYFRCRYLCGLHDSCVYYQEGA